MSDHSPGPWQKSHYVRHRRYRHMSQNWHDDNELRESNTIRGPGKIGTPECNVVAYVECANPADRALFIRAWEIPELERKLEQQQVDFEKAVSRALDTTPPGREFLKKLSNAEARIKELREALEKIEKVIGPHGIKADLTITGPMSNEDTTGMDIYNCKLAIVRVLAKERKIENEIKK